MTVSGPVRVSFAVASTLMLALLAGCGPKYPKCEADDHCSEKGQVCVEGLCQQCRADDGCGAGQQCKAGRCEAKPECGAATDCSDGKVCRSGKCQLECSAEDPCGPGQKCSENRCVAECEGPADCGAGKGCVAGRCQVQEVKAVTRMSCEYPSIRFAYNAALLDPEARAALDDLALCLKEGTARILIEGHCDERGSEEWNLQLGEERARSVKKYLAAKGVDDARIELLSKGETEPLDSGSSEEAWSRNRRAEFETR